MEEDDDDDDEVWKSVQFPAFLKISLFWFLGGCVSLAEGRGLFYDRPQLTLLFISTNSRIYVSLSFVDYDGCFGGLRSVFGQKSFGGGDLCQHTFNALS